MVELVLSQKFRRVFDVAHTNVIVTVSIYKKILEKTSKIFPCETSFLYRKF